jgi:hypothetical protein
MEPEQKDNAAAPHVDLPEQKHDPVTGFVSAAKESAQEALIPKWLMPFVKWFKTEWSGVKTGRTLFYMLMAISLVVGVVVGALGM